MAGGSSSYGGRQVWYLETIEESDEELEEDLASLGVRRRGRVSLVKQSTPAQSEESRFTVSGSGDSSLVSWPQRALHSRDPPRGLLPSLQEADDAPAGSDQSQPPDSPLQPLAEQSQRPLKPGRPSAEVISPGGWSPFTKDMDAENEAEGQPQPTEGKVKEKRRPNRRLSMRSKDGEVPNTLKKKKRNRRPRKSAKMASPAVPEWLVNLMHSIEEATHHELIIE